MSSRTWSCQNRSPVRRTRRSIKCYLSSTVHVWGRKQMTMLLASNICSVSSGTENALYCWKPLERSHINNRSGIGKEMQKKGQRKSKRKVKRKTKRKIILIPGGKRRESWHEEIQAREGNHVDSEPELSCPGNLNANKLL